MLSPLKNRRPVATPRSPSTRSGQTLDWSDGELLARCREGRNSAWNEVVNRYGQLVYSIPRRYGLDTATCDDVFQEVFAALLASLPRIRRPDRLRSWLLTTAHRICRRHYGRKAAEPLLESPRIDASPADQAARIERHRLVRQAVQELGGPCQRLLEALFLRPNPMEYEQVARELNIPVGSIGPTRARCLARLLEVVKRLEA